jgi:tetratricopeptide (TPR) repeat protein
VQAGRQALADRYTYIPMIGIYLAICFECRYWQARWRMPAAGWSAIAACVLAACLFLTRYQLRFWLNTETLFTRALAVTSDNGVAHLNLGLAHEEAGRLENALAEYEQALRVESELAQVHNNLGNILEKLGRSTEALAHYREGLRLNPNAPLLHANVGTLLLKLGQYQEAMSQYAEASRLSPRDPRPHYLMGKALLRQGQAQEALTHLRQALQLGPNHLQTLVFVARVLATAPDQNIRNANEAIRLAEHANALTAGQQAFVLDTLAIAYAEAGRFDDARKKIESALERAQSEHDHEALVQLREHLRCFEAQRPIRENFTNVLSEASGK